MEIARVAALAGFVWAVLALAAQLRTAHAGGRPHYGVPRGRSRRGVVYFFTAAMLPQHKESVRHHPGKFAVGMVMHLAVAAALAGALVMVIQPAVGIAWMARLRPLLAAGLAAGLYLFVRRCASRDLKVMSTPDDHLAILSTLGLLAAMAIVDAGPGLPAAALIYTAALLVYVPLGKLRHVVFFFAARTNYGGRLGWRGVYPPAAGEAN